MDHIDNKLTSQLYRIDCPTTDALGEYHLNMLSDEQAQHVRHHVGICPHCSQELAQLVRYLTDLAPELDYTLREKIQIWVAKVIPTNLNAGLSPVANPALALRGETDEPLMYEAGSYQLNLEVQDDPTESGHKSVLGLLIGSDDSVFEAQLWQNGRSVQQTPIDDLGNFVFTRVLPGTYDLILSQHAAEIHVQAFQI